ncbi:hypothetical protein ACQEVZ_53885 [Dactylosporangium sp. CA-152071]
MRKRLASLAVAGLVGAALVALPQSPAAAAPSKELSDGIKRQLAAGVQVVPKQQATLKAPAGAVNPYTALL